MARQAVRLHFRIFPEDSLWVGECSELGVSTSAETEAEAVGAIDEATQLYLATLARIIHERPGRAARWSQSGSAGWQDASDKRTRPASSRTRPPTFSSRNRRVSNW
jgi:predicted RNase H-like HicB family nuclease